MGVFQPLKSWVHHFFERTAETMTQLSQERFSIRMSRLQQPMDNSWPQLIWSNLWRSTEARSGSWNALSEIRKLTPLMGCVSTSSATDSIVVCIVEVRLTSGTDSSVMIATNTHRTRAHGFSELAIHRFCSTAIKISCEFPPDRASLSQKREQKSIWMI